ncbi:glycosyltransferase [Methanosarcina sp. DH1]|uniref:glycosyltransferase family 4 protein n=1 Tax=Methanosarcina sp. DH1 TaxID=2605695 RepID=UPI001E312D31|nr:glycosyltransferase family 4 protein [Methanosarcina sp. DH1]MCC4767345.1 glycosyltransferase [Methanosarcina sp. DH1]
MNILIISPFRIYPIYSGFSTRVYNLTKQLSNFNSIFLFYIDYYKKYPAPDNCNFLPNVKKCSFKVPTKFMQLLDPYLILKGIDVIKKEKIDLVIAEGIWAGLHAMIFRALTKVPYCLTEHNVEYVRWKRMGMKYPGLLRVFERYCCKFSDKVFCMSDDDRKQINKLGVELKKTVVIPNGYDPTIFYPNNKNKKAVREEINVNDETPLILFSGNFSYKPNLQAVSIIHDTLVDKVLNKIPNAKFLIVGSHPPLQYKHKGIIFTGFVDKIEDYINASDIVIAPLVSGGGTKLKIIEAISCGKVVITTDIGAEGLVGGKTNNFLVITDDWSQFANEIVSILKSPINNKVPEEFTEKFSWNRIIKKINNEICGI